MVGEHSAFRTVAPGRTLSPADTKFKSDVPRAFGGILTQNEGNPSDLRRRLLVKLRTIRSFLTLDLASDGAPADLHQDISPPRFDHTSLEPSSSLRLAGNNLKSRVPQKVQREREIARNGSRAMEQRRRTPRDPSELTVHPARMINAFDPS